MILLDLLMPPGPDGLEVLDTIFDYSVESKAKCDAFAASRGQKLIVESVAGAVGAGIPEVQQATRRPTCSACGLSKRYLMNRAAVDHGYPVTYNDPEMTQRMMMTKAMIYARMQRYEDALAQIDQALAANPEGENNDGIKGMLGHFNSGSTIPASEIPGTRSARPGIRHAS